MFRPVNSKVNFPQVEENILRWWQDKAVFQRSIDQRQGKPRFNLYDGPPTVNGSPAIHHALTSIFKDVIPRYKAMKGYYTPRIGGWDTHGLPVELEIEKKLGFSGKAQIEEYGVDKFNALCRESVGKYRKEFEDIIERVGYWVDLEHPYVTMDNNYIESVWWAIKQMWDKGLVYQGYRVTPHCPRCGTSLSSHEVAQGYKDDVEDTSVYVRFRLGRRVQNRQAHNVLEKLGYDFQKAGWKEEIPSFLAWTTTPWTLTANVALAVAPNDEYVLVQARSPQGVNERLILAKARLDQALGTGKWQILQEFKGRDLANILYERVYEFKSEFVSDDKGQRLLPENRVVFADFVSMEDGTGIVHIAPAYGEEDYEVGRSESLPVVHTVGLAGRLKPNNRPWDGMFVKEADPLIIKDLALRNLLYRSETIRHTYPFCWRCESPLLYYAKQAWYIRTSAVKEQLISGNAEINWYPEHIKQGRFGDWLQNNVDWAVSRERYWGTPLPVWRCESCGSYDCIGGVEELTNKPGFSGLREPVDLHRPYVDEITFTCSKCGGTMRRVPEVIDCWFDSGAMPFAQYHYLGAEDDTLLSDGRFPADYICEAIDQTRGWFYTLHAISTLLFDRPSFKNVICLGHILDAKGEKMSKRKGNAALPWPVINKYGADALRWYFFTSSPPGNPRRFSEDMVAEVSRRFLSTLWNTYSFFVLYANIDNFIPDEKTLRQVPISYGMATKSLTQGGQELPELDGWILSELNQLILDVDSALDKYDPREAGRKIESFVDELSNWYVRRSRRRFWKSENDTDKLAAYNTLYRCLVTVAKLMAPLTPFLAEEVYQNLVRSVSSEAPESVHLADFPVADESQIHQQLADDNRLAMKVSSLGRAARAKAGIKVRQPLAHVVVSVAGSNEQGSLERLKPQILEELNVKDLKFNNVIEVQKLEGYGYVVGGDGGSYVAVPRDISPELLAEGMVREIVHRLQTMRKNAGFDIADHIVTYYQGNAYIKQVMVDFTDYIKQETLSREIVEVIPEEGIFAESYKLDGNEIRLGVKRLA